MVCMNIRKKYLSCIETDTDGSRYDVTPVFADREVLNVLCDDLTAQFDVQNIDYVAGIDALGFLLGMAVASRINKGFIPVRKAGKLPVPVFQRYFIDYTGQQKGLELNKKALIPGSRVLMVDEWIETGVQMQAAISLIEEAGGIIVGIAAVQMDDSEIVRQLKTRYTCSHVWNEEI